MDTWTPWTDTWWEEGRENQWMRNSNSGQPQTDLLEQQTDMKTEWQLTNWFRKPPMHQTLKTMPKPSAKCSQGLNSWIFPIKLKVTTRSNTHPESLRKNPAPTDKKSAVLQGSYWLRTQRTQMKPDYTHRLRNTCPLEGHTDVEMKWIGLQKPNTNSTNTLDWTLLPARVHLELHSRTPSPTQLTGHCKTKDLSSQVTVESWTHPVGGPLYSTKFWKEQLTNHLD